VFQPQLLGQPAFAHAVQQPIAAALHVLAQQQ
jgi:hypothetical protein